MTSLPAFELFWTEVLQVMDWLGSSEMKKRENK